jgi:hypothetical protein
VAKEFVLTTEHLKLLKRMYTGWQDCEYGAPEINPKRPYGNSDVAGDVAEILGISPEGDDGYGDCLSKSQREYCDKLHRETETALLIFLQHAKLSPGKYAEKNYSDWEKA